MSGSASATELKSLILYGQPSPNPWKVATILEELSLPYTTIHIPIHAAKSPQILALNSNGRLPILQDPNQQQPIPTSQPLTLWESNAIITYLISTYDPSGTLGSVAPDDAAVQRWQTTQWLYFQASGQGPYFGQAAWFNYAPHTHPEVLPGVVKRYTDEIERVTGVLDTALRNKEWLVGNRCSGADPVFMGLDGFPGFIFKGEEDVLGLRARFPAYGAGVGRMMERPSVRKVLVEEQETLWTKAE